MSNDYRTAGKPIAGRSLRGRAPIVAVEVSESADRADAAERRVGLCATCVHRREVPKDVSLISFEQQVGHSHGSNLTSVCVDMAEVGRQLARLAIAQIESQHPSQHKALVPTVFVKRSSCRPLRQEEQMLL